MSHVLSDYKVLGVVERSDIRSYYRVEEKATGKMFIWEAVDYGLLSNGSKSVLESELEALKSVVHPHLISCVGNIDHIVTSTLYLIKEYCGGSVAALINKCRSTNSFVDEDFVWRILYQTARAAQARYSKGTQSMKLDLSTSGVNLDEDGNVKLNYWIDFKETDDGPINVDFPVKKKKSDTWSLGNLILELTTLQRFQQSHKQIKIPNQYSEDLQKIINIMLHDAEKRPTIEGVLYHPALVSHVVINSLQQIKITGKTDTSSTSSEHSSSIGGKLKDIEYRLQSIRKREASFKNKELELKEKERNLLHKEKQVLLLERLAKEKMQRAEVYLSQSRKGRCGISVRGNEPPNDLDSSSYSADPGDTSILPTSAKIDPSRILRPPSLAPSLSSRRSVRFETIPEFDEPRKNREQMTWLKNKRAKYKEKRSKTGSILGKENQPITSTSDVSDKRAKSCTGLSFVPDTKETRSGILETFFK